MSGNRLTPYILTPERSAEEGFNIMIYGDQGVGKTYLAATCQDSKDMKDVLFCNADRGTKTIAARRDIRTINIEDFAHLEEIFWAVANRKGKFKNIKTVVVDSISEIQYINVVEISKKKGHKDQVYLEDWGTSTIQLRRIFQMFKELNINVIITALAKTISVPGGEMERVPELTSKLGNAMMAYMDMVWYMYVEESDTKTDKWGEPKVYRRLRTRSTYGIRAKTRGPRFAEAIGPVVTSPNMAKLYEVYKQAEGVKTNGKVSGSGKAKSKGKTSDEK